MRTSIGQLPALSLAPSWIEPTASGAAAVPCITMVPSAKVLPLLLWPVR